MGMVAEAIRHVAESTTADVVNSKYGDMVMEVSMNYHQRHTVSIEL